MMFQMFHFSTPCSQTTSNFFSLWEGTEFNSHMERKNHNYNFLCITLQRSRYSDWLQAGRPRDRSSSPSGGNNFLFSTSSRPALGPTQPPIQGEPGVKRPGREADHSPPTGAEVKKMWIYTNSLIHLHGVVVN
jgi:hypothetical protein